MATCRLPGCTNDVEGRADKQFCCDAHKQKYWRDEHKKDQAQGATFTAMLSELVELRAKVQDQAQTIEDQAREISRLAERLNVEKRYLQERATRQYGFKAFIKKQQPRTPLIEKLLADQFFMPRDSRAHYEYRLGLLHCTEEERQEFTDLWKLMLLLQP